MNVDKSPPTVRQGISRVPVVSSSTPLVKEESGAKTTVVHEVRKVLICIPPELSATGFELKIVGLVKLLRKAGTCN